MSETNHFVMIIDDDHDIRESVAEILVDLGYQPIKAINGRDAIDRLRSDQPKPCVILLDLMMPVMDGQEFREVQQKDATLEGIPVVVISAHTHADDLARKMAVAAAIKKPIDLDQLMSTIRRFCPEIRA
jgi:CheY-like chemotaxis protein